MVRMREGSNPNYIADDFRLSHRFSSPFDGVRLPAEKGGQGDGQPAYSI
ncbi:MAG: hypothetical protein ACFCU6_07010 [Balneolaceae bacterium]